MNTKRFLILLLTLIYGSISYAQVKGISYTLAPSAEYVWWNDKAGLENTSLVGGKVGLGFGEFFELRGSYMQSLSLQNDFGGFDIPGYDGDAFNATDVELKRYGGEVKANLSRGRLLPFLLLGTGIQSLELDGTDIKNEQIYLTAGAGITLGIADRFTLVLEARNNAYRFNSGVNLLSDQDKSDLGVANSFFKRENLNNWSAGAALQFYLGGRKPGTMSELDKAYFDSFSGGLSGLNLGLEVVGGQMNFDKNLAYRDTRILGASAGFDFGPYVGLRGFYWQGVENSWTKRDDLAMWGGEMRMKLNTSGGMVPFIMLGGGMIDVNDDYVGREYIGSDSTVVTARNVEDTPFAMGGAGMLIPVSKNLKIFGSARAIITSQSPLDDLAAPEGINTSWFYSAGVKLNFGKKKKSPKAIMNQQITDALDAQKEENDARAEALKLDYEQKIVKLEQDLITAYENNDLEKAKMLKGKKEEAEKVVLELEKVDEPVYAEETTVIAPSAPILMQNAPPAVNTTTPGLNNVTVAPTGSEIRMSPAEFENLIEEILEGVESSSYPTQAYPQYQTPTQYAPMPQNDAAALRIMELEQQVQTLKGGQEVEVEVETEVIESSEEMEEPTSNIDSKVMEKLYQLEEKLEENSKQMDVINKRLNITEEAEVEEKKVKKWRLFKKKKKNKDEE